MIRLALRCLPAGGRPDLEWFSGLTGSLDQIYLFLLRAEIREQFAASAGDRRDRPDDLRRIIDGRAIELGTPTVRRWTGGLVIDLAVPVTTGAIPVQALASLGSLFAAGPEVAAWSHHLKRAWFDADDESAGVRQAYEWIRNRAAVSPVDNAPPTLRKGRKGRKPRRQADLPAGVRRSPPLGR